MKRESGPFVAVTLDAQQLLVLIKALSKVPGQDDLKRYLSNCMEAIE